MATTATVVTKNIQENNSIWENANLYKLGEAAHVTIYHCGGDDEDDYEFIIVELNPDGRAEIFAARESEATVTWRPLHEIKDAHSHEAALEMAGYQLVTAA